MRIVEDDESQLSSDSSVVHKGNNRSKVIDDNDDSSDEEEEEEEEEAFETMSESHFTTATSPNGTIALFGAYGKTGHQFLRLALDAGYSVRALLLPATTCKTSKKTVTAASLKEEFTDQPALRWIPSRRLDDPKSCKRALKGADYVVCMLADTVYTESGGSKKKKRMTAFQLTSFVKMLYPLMKEQGSIQVFLYQATSLAADVKGVTPILSQVLKTVAHYRRSATQGAFLQDQDSVISQIALHHGESSTSLKPTTQQKKMVRKQKKRQSTNSRTNSKASGGSQLSSRADEGESDEESTGSVENISTAVTEPADFAYIVTRPTVLLKDGPSLKKVAASKSQPGPFPITHVDLAEFSLNALLTKKLYNTCPYVVADSF